MARFELLADFTPLVKAIAAVDVQQAAMTAGATPRTAHTTFKTSLTTAMNGARNIEGDPAVGTGVTAGDD